MKLRRLPDDFDVEELAEAVPGDGPFALYRLTKRSLGTPEAVQAVLQRWKLPPASISYGGLKDRHAVTRQYLTIRGGPHRGLEQEHLRLDYLGQTAHPFGSPDIAGNRFTIVLRNLTAAELAQAQGRLSHVQSHGVPNYFDDQRFGSLGKSGEFVARPWCLGDYERALWLALAEENPHDRPDDREEKRILRDHWGRWEECQALLPSSRGRSAAAIVAHLAARPTDYRGALARIGTRCEGCTSPLSKAPCGTGCWRPCCNRLVRPSSSAMLKWATNHSPFRCSSRRPSARPCTPPNCRSRQPGRGTRPVPMPS